VKNRFFIALLALLLLGQVVFLASQSSAAENPPASNFSLKTLAGTEVSLDQHRGKYLLINFWATWCGPCKIEMPSLQALYTRFKSEKFELLAISNDMFGEKVVRPYIEANNLDFPVLLDQNLKVSHKYGVVTLPTSFLVDPEGKIIGVLNGAINWEDPETLLYFDSLLKNMPNPALEKTVTKASVSPDVSVGIGNGS
jgi:peroxiredoxin